ncbi:hypothetical protein [Variovorax sp. YR216]|uniref:hypothetical protein n=1 Tax=Variovorax sp. YR216 TaxID=1882828 RepID=UPI000894B0C3|nr:hypothetical protein [Variovorax sp. YR216]SEA55766.1 hypothetical protein SAMN05444680_102895 [Variovorax sp. YR216]
MNQPESPEVRRQDAFLLSVAGWQHLLQDSAEKLQQAQLRAWGAMTQTYVALYQDAWDRWTARFGGGVPLDG